jgi:trimethylamine--corrinoid protein Co-methyltransferase
MTQAGEGLQQHADDTDHRKHHSEEEARTMTYSETPPLEPIVPAYRLRILSDEQLAQLQAATLTLLEKVGIHSPSEKALRIYAEHGAQVDFGTKIVRLSPDLVLDSLSHAPRYYTMGARSPAHDLQLDGKAFYCATDGCGTRTIDFETRQERRSEKEDVAKMARVSDYLSSISFYWPIVSAQDHPATAPLHELDASFNSTVKHVQTETVMDEAMARYAVEMAKVIAGDEETMRQRPPLSSLICTIAPLGHDVFGMDAALVFAEAGLPVGFMSMANTGSTAPATNAGTIALADAEMVSAMVLMQMAYPGAPVYHSMMTGVMHPRTGDYLSAASVIYAIGVELAHMWGVPTLAGTSGGDAPEPGWHMGAMEGAGTMLCALCGAETGSGMGLLKGSTLLYPEALVLQTEIYHSIREDLAGLDTSQEQLALDVIETVGPRGHFLTHGHTRDHLREQWFSELTAQPVKGGGFRDPIEVAREKTDWILENHHPEPLSDDQRAEFSKILAAAEQELGESDRSAP